MLAQREISSTLMSAPEEAEVYTPDDVFQYAFPHRNTELADMLDPDLDRGMVLPIPIHGALE